MVSISFRIENHEQPLDDYYAALLDNGIPLDDGSLYHKEDSDEEDSIHNTSTEHKENSRNIKDILDDLATQLTLEKTSIFNISRSYLWEGTKRALSRKKFSPKHKVNVKFTDDSGNSEGAVDMGGPMREYFTLAMQWIESNLFCGDTFRKFLFFQAKFLEENDYLFAGTVIALSIVHGGPGPQSFAPQMFDVIAGCQSKMPLSLEDIYDCELKSSLEKVLKAKNKDEAKKLVVNDKLETIMELAGTYQPVNELSDATKIVHSTMYWFVLGRAYPAIESFKKGLATLGVLQALKDNPDSFRPVFCQMETKVTTELLEDLFKVIGSPTGSNKATVESLVLSRWHDYIQDIEDGDEKDITLIDILFFTTGCKSLPPRSISPTIEFLHENEAWGQQSRFPKANTCSAVLWLPVVHATYESFKEDMSFGILNGRGFGSA